MLLNFKIFEICIMHEFTFRKVKICKHAWKKVWLFGIVNSYICKVWEVYPAHIKTCICMEIRALLIILLKKSSNCSNLINKCKRICRGLGCPSVRVLVTVRLLRECGYSWGRCGRLFRGGTLINNCNKLCVYMAHWLCACMKLFKKKRKARSLFDRFHSLKSNLLSISCSQANPIDFSIALPKFRCGTGCSMRACHAAGPGSVPGRDKFSGWGFLGFFLTCKTNARKL